jgi:riboflavin synthase
VFTGIVTGTGTVRSLGAGPGARRLAIDAGAAAAAWHVGDSVAVAGACLTLVSVAGTIVEADLSDETLARTTLGRLGPGHRVNLEGALAAGAPLGGHLVTGHVDGVASVRSCRESGGALHANVEAPAALARFIAEKGSVTLDGVSLTVARVDGAAFGVDIVPHTRAVTTLGDLTPGKALNLEVDLVARYLDRLLEARGRP